MFKASWKVRRIAHKLSESQLRQLKGSESHISDKDLIGSSAHSSVYFLGYYSKSGLELALQQYGIFDALKERGYHKPVLRLETEDPYRQRMAIYDESTPDAPALLIDAVLRQYALPITLDDSTEEEFEVLYIEWLTLQHPKATFSKEKPQLPGQQYPGLGGGKIALELLTMICHRIGLDGIINVPEYFHNAQLYSRHFSYLDPVLEGKRRAIARDLLSHHTLAETSWGIDLDCVHENGLPFKWFTGPQILPLNRKLIKFFESSEYIHKVLSAQKSHHYEMDITCLKTNRPQLFD
jgi:hypothetical protein